jgi:hypothetical protein
MTNMSGSSEGWHGQYEAVASVALGVGGSRAVGLVAAGAGGSAVGVLAARGAVGTVAGWEVAALVAGILEVDSTRVVTVLGVCPAGRARQPDNRTNAHTTRTGTAAQAHFLDVLGWVNVNILLLFCEWSMAVSSWLIQRADAHQKMPHIMR